MPAAAGVYQPEAPSCLAETSYLLAGNSGAVILLSPDATQELGERVIVYRPRLARGWASQRLLRRFDLALSGGRDRIPNAGVYCIEGG
ncbi:MAG: hypothetical protein ACX939_02015 [Hyphococcus sp.]